MQFGISSRNSFLSLSAFLSAAARLGVLFRNDQGLDSFFELSNRCAAQLISEVDGLMSVFRFACRECHSGIRAEAVA